MPGMDRTGPFGSGPMGRGMGCCGWRQNRDIGQGFHHIGGVDWGLMPMTLSNEEERGLLEHQKRWLEKKLSTITLRLSRLEKTKETESIEPADEENP